MRVGLLIIAHHPLGEAVLETAIGTLGHAPLPCRVLPVTRDADPDALVAEARQLAEGLNQGGGLLVLTDIYGSTPSNIACRLEGSTGVRVIAGLNLPMLIRVFNYAELTLDQLAEKALSGGHDGILSCCELTPAQMKSHAQ